MVGLSLVVAVAHAGWLIYEVSARVRFPYLLSLMVAALELIHCVVSMHWIISISRCHELSVPIL